jgi:hypothetical protein
MKTGAIVEQWLGEVHRKLVERSALADIRNENAIEYFGGPSELEGVIGAVCTATAIVIEMIVPAVDNAGKITREYNQQFAEQYTEHLRRD